VREGVRGGKVERNVKSGIRKRKEKRGEKVKGKKKASNPVDPVRWKVESLHL